MTLTEAEWDDLVADVYERARGGAAWYDNGSGTGTPDDESTDDRLTFGAWRAAIDAFLAGTP